MAWLIYPVYLLQREWPWRGVGFILLLCISLLIVLPAWSITLSAWVFAVLCYLVVAIFWNIYNEIKRLHKYLDDALTADASLSVDNASWVILQPVVGALQSVLLDAERRQQRLQQRLDEISHASQELENSAIAVTRNAEQQSDAAMTAAAAVEELNTSIRHVAELADSSREASLGASEQLHNGAQQLTVLVQKVTDMASEAASAHQLIQQLREQSSTINTMSGTIKDIAEQTNLLALNAAIEAARAGESGRGFAVVADEVRRLAQHSQESAAVIGKNSETVQRHIGHATEKVSVLSRLAVDGAEQAEAARDRLNQVQTTVQVMTEQVVQVAVSMEQQGQAVAEIAHLAEQVRQGNQDNVHAAAQARSIAHHLAYLTGADS